MYSFSLPYPPSVNRYWRSWQGRVIVSRAGREYRARVACEIASCSWWPQPTLEGPLAITIALHPPDRRRRDLDNTLKAMLDALTYAGVYADDSQICDIRIVRKEVRRCGLCYVDLTQVPEMAYV